MPLAARALRHDPHQAEILAGTPEDTAAPAALDLVTTLDGFRALEDDWNDLFARAGTNRHLFQTFNWLWHWANHFLPQTAGADTSLAIVTARRDGRLVMVWPLVAERAGPVTQLVWMGEPVSQYGDLIVEAGPDTGALLDASWRFVAERTGADVLRLRKVRQDSNVAALLETLGGIVTSELKAPYLDLASAPSFDAYEKRYSSGAKRNRKRQRRRLEERGPAGLIAVKGGEEAAALTAQAFTLKQDWLRQRGIVSPAFADPRTERFFADVTRAETRPAGCHVLALTCNGAPVALEIGVRCLGRSAIHIIAYDAAFEKTAAGALLMEDSIRHAFEDGMTVFDLLAPGDGYKLEWADDAMIVRDWAQPISLAGRAYATLYLRFLRNASKRALDRLPVGARRLATQALARWMRPAA